MIENRIAWRAEVRLEASVATVISSGEGTITDLSMTGAKIMYEGARQGERISLVALGQDVCGTVAWVDPDRFGMRFDQPLRAGPLHDYLSGIAAPRRPAPAPRRPVESYEAPVTVVPPRRPVFGRRNP